MGDAWDRFPAVSAGGSFATFPEVLDFNAPVKDIRQKIASLPAEEQAAAQRAWAEHRVAKTPQLTVPSPARGIPIIGPYLDEATAAINAGLGAVTDYRIGAPYDEALAEERARGRAATAKYPAETALGNLAAGIVTGGPILSRLAPAATLAGRIGQGAVTGGAIGAVEGFGEGEGTAANRASQAVSGGKMGAVVGGAFPVLAAGVTRGGTALAETMAPHLARLRAGPGEAADVILAQRIAREGSSPAQKRLDLQHGQGVDARMAANSTATLPETLADTSDAMQRLTGSVYRTGGEAGNFVRDELNRRQRGVGTLYGRQGNVPDGQMGRIMDATERAMLIRSSGTAHQTEQRIMREQQAEGRRLYDQARQNSEAFDLQPQIDAMALTAMNYTGAFRARLLRAINLFRDETPQRFPVNNIERFDAAKKSLDDMIESGQRQGQGNFVRELTGFKRSLLDAVEAPDAAGAATRNVAYRQAREAWGTAAENRAAIDLGRSAMRDGSEVSVEQFRDLTRGQQQLFRLGFLESVRNALSTKRPGNDVTQLFEQQRVRDLMREIIPRSRGSGVFADRPERFGRLIEREQRMVQTRNVALGNSATAQRQGDDAALAGEALAGMWNRFRQSPSLFNMGVEAIGAGMQRIFGYRQDVALALAQRLLEADPNVRNQILRRLRARGGPDVFARFAETVDRSALALAGSTTAPALEDQSR